MIFVKPSCGHPWQQASEQVSFYEQKKKVKNKRGMNNKSSKLTQESLMRHMSKYPSMSRRKKPKIKDV